MIWGVLPEVGVLYAFAVAFLLYGIGKGHLDDAAPFVTARNAGRHLDNGLRHHDRGWRRARVVGA